MREEILRWKFPNLRYTRFQITSPATHVYNCIAWAAGDDANWWSTDDFPDGAYVWPQSVPRENTIENWVTVFRTLGFTSCEHGNPEEGFEKLAIYADADRVPLHVARQLPSGRWTSKLGQLEDIEHELHGLTGESYGEVVAYLRRSSRG